MNDQPRSRYVQLALEAQDRIDNDGRDTREVLDWFAERLCEAQRDHVGNVRSDIEEWFETHDPDRLVGAIQRCEWLLTQTALGVEDNQPGENQGGVTE